MKVDRNQPIHQQIESFEGYETSDHDFPFTTKLGGGIPLRLEIASRLIPMIAGFVADGLDHGAVGRHDCTLEALRWADALIEKHNNTCEEKK